MAAEELTCRKIVELVSEYLEDDLEEDDRRAFELHLRSCDGCVNYLDQMRETIRLTGMLSEESLPPEVRAELVLAFRDWAGREL